MLLSVSEGVDGGDAPSGCDRVSGPAAQREAAAEADARPSTTTSGISHTLLLLADIIHI